MERRWVVAAGGIKYSKGGSAGLNWGAFSPVGGKRTQTDTQLFPFSKLEFVARPTLERIALTEAAPLA